MIANLLEVAGVTHVITIDLHASQMQGFFRCPIDNLVAEPLLAHWIKRNIPDWRKAVVVSKNPGGTKRVTSLADALKLNFGIIMTDRRRPGSGMASLNTSIILDEHNTGDRYAGNTTADYVDIIIPPGSRAFREATSGQNEQSTARPNPTKHINIRNNNLNSAKATGHSIRPTKADPVKQGLTRVQTTFDTRRSVGRTSEEEPENQVSVLCVFFKLSAYVVLAARRSHWSPGTWPHRGR